MKALQIALYQQPIHCGDITQNLHDLAQHLHSLDPEVDLLILPEMFATGFDFNDLSLAQSVDGLIITQLKQWAKLYDLAFAGSFLCSEKENRYNRGFFIAPTQSVYYDKRHLFRMSDEIDCIQAGTERPIVHFKGWNILLQVCYDLRFPVWSRNVANEYDLLIYVACWPEVRQNAWESLLKARAIENCCYVAGVNRMGSDQFNLVYAGGSQVIDMKGNTLCRATDHADSVTIQRIDLAKLQQFRERFPVWQDADTFTIL